MSLLFFVPAFLIAITVHEVAHAYVAWRLGDPTARAMGRITLNPLRHIDPFGLIILIIFRFGWAKPVLINPRNFKNEKMGMALSALAGPVSNIALAFLGLIISNIILVFAVNAEITINSSAGNVIMVALSFFGYFAFLNVWLALFNLLPVPPLDGSRIVNYFLPPHLSRYYEYVERYGLIIIILLMVTVLRTPMGFVADAILALLNFPLNWFFGLFL